MDSLTDQQLLRDYAERRSEEAFAELVRRHLDFVYSAALRMTGNPSLAEDVTQGVFLALVRQAGRLAEHPAMTGWLHCTARNLAGNTVRSEVRRRAREQEAAAMNEPHSTEADAPWERIAPHLDAALGELSETDREAILLRYFERKAAREMAQSLGISEDAAQRRLTRAVERLRVLFQRRGIAVGTSGMVAVMSAHGVQAAPVGLGGAITASAVTLSIPTVIATTTLTKGILIMSSTNSKLVIASIAALLLVGGGTTAFFLNRASADRRVVTGTSPQESLAPDAQASLPVTLTAADLEGVKTNGNRIDIQVQGGALSIKREPASLLGSVSFKGNTLLSEAELMKAITSKVGERVDQTKIDQDITTILKLYEQAGQRGISVRAARETSTGATQSSLVFLVQEAMPK